MSTGSTTTNAATPCVEGGDAADGLDEAARDEAADDGLPLHHDAAGQVRDAADEVAGRGNIGVVLGEVRQAVHRVERLAAVHREPPGEDDLLLRRARDDIAQFRREGLDRGRKTTRRPVLLHLGGGGGGIVVGDDGLLRCAAHRRLIILQQTRLHRRVVIDLWKRTDGREGRWHHVLRLL